MTNEDALGRDLVGQTLSHYRIAAPIGAGGMGEVYRATDTRLDREVAIKILPPSHARRPEFLARFEREAKAISALNHPHVCTLHDVGHEGDVRFLVMELIEGESVADRLRRGPLPLAEVLRYGAQIADALEAAHRHGIVHRDLKPGNVMLTKSGAKLLDFGLARSGVDATSAVSAPSAVQTEHKPLTQQGTILGTFQYMAPEQLEGLEADARTDIFALGALLYEMATGQRAFRGESKTSLIAAIVSSQPAPVSQVVKTSPPALDHVVRTCLAKDPDERWQSARDVKAELLWIGESGSPAGAPAVVVSRRRWRERVAWGLAVVSTVLAAALAFTRGAREPRPPSAPLRLALYPPPGMSFPDGRFTTPVVSPDGRHVAFEVEEEPAKIRLWVRSLDSLDARPLPDTEGVWQTFWSPDSRSVAFVANGTLKVVDLAGGAARVIADHAFQSGAWNRDGVILFTAQEGQPLSRMSADGGPPTAATSFDASRREVWHCCPQFLPDSRHFLFFGGAQGELNEYVGSLDSRVVKPLASPGVYAWPGYMLWAGPPARTVQAAPFDARRLESAGPRVVVTPESVSRWADSDLGYFSASQTGVLAFRPAGQVKAGSTRLFWFDRSGRETGTVPAAPGAENPELSPDGRRVLLDRKDPDTGARDVWVMDLDRGVESRLTFDKKADEANGLWSKDGSRIIWSTQAGRTLVSEASAAGGASRPLVDRDEREIWVLSWSPDGRHVLCGNWTGGHQTDILVLDLEGKAAPEPFEATAFKETVAQFSPNGKWVAFESDETDRTEVYVRPFPRGPGKWRVSAEGGASPRWRADGKELFYIAPDRKLMSVPIGGGPDSLSPGPARPLFQTRISGQLAGNVRENYAVSRDGQRFLIVTDLEKPVSQPITVIVNWPALLEQKGRP